MSSLNLKNIVFWCFVPSMMLDYFMLMLGIDLHRIIAGPFILAVDFFAILYIIKSSREKNRPWGKNVFLIWFFYNILSILGYLWNGKPIECYFEILRPLIFPMLFFFVGNDYKEKGNRFYDIYLISCIVCFVIGIILFVSMPPFYLDYLKRMMEDSWYEQNTSESYLMEFGRMSSFFKDSYAISYLSVPALALSLGFMMKKTKFNQSVLYFFAFICFLSAMLCQQRAAMAGAMLVFVFFLFYNNKISKTKVIVVAVLFIVVGSIYIVNDERYDAINTMITSRFEDMSSKESLNSGRTDQYTSALDGCNNILFGDGIGSGSSIIRKYGFKGVSDGEYVRILVENGIVGLFLFLLLIVNTVKRCFNDLKKHATELCIVCFFLLAMTGSNSLSINFFYSCIFWYAIGNVWRPQIQLELSNKKLTKL